MAVARVSVIKIMPNEGKNAIRILAEAPGSTAMGTVIDQGTVGIRGYSAVPYCSTLRQNGQKTHRRDAEDAE